MKLSININPNIAPLAYVPKTITNAAMVVYLAALVTCLVVYNAYALDWQWMIFGIVEVCGFFFLTNHLSKAWINMKSKTFTKNIFWWSFALRLLWVVISYLLYKNWTGTPFSIGAADELFYDDMGHYGASLLRDGVLSIYTPMENYAGGVGFSDMGYPIYLSIVYYIFGDSIFIARVLKAIWSAWTAVLIYKLASRNFGESTGRIAAIFCMLMPNLIYYCSLQLKEVEMVFLTILFAERADYLLRKGKLTFLPTFLLLLIPVFMFMIRTALAATLVLAFFCTLLLSSDRIISWSRRVMLIILAGVFAVIMLMTSTSIGKDIQQMWEIRGTTQEAHAEWRSLRKDEGGFRQSFARYSGAAVFAPMIFTLPFPTMAETEGQENQKMIHGGNFVKNIISYFTIVAIVLLLFSGNWRRHVLPMAILLGYLVVLVFSNFAHSERFHLPILPFTMLFAAYGIGLISQKKWIKKYFPYWCALMFIAAIAWNWFKLAGRGMI